MAPRFPPPPTDPTGRISRQMLELAEGQRRLTDAEIAGLAQHIAAVGFDPNAKERLRGRGAVRHDGTLVIWSGVLMTGNTLVSPELAHFLRHVEARPEWPRGTTPATYVQSIKAMVIDPTTAIFSSRYEGLWQVGFVRPSGPLRGPLGSEWLVVEFRVERGYWTTAYQTADAPDTVVSSPRRSDVRWWRMPTR